MTSPETQQSAPSFAEVPAWPSGRVFAADQPHPSTRSLIFSAGLFVATLLSSLIAGTHFAAAYAHNQAASLDAFLQIFRLVYRNPMALLAGLPFALTLLRGIATRLRCRPLLDRAKAISTEPGLIRMTPSQ